MAVNEKEKPEIVFEIKEHLGILNEYNNGWTKELNVVAWNDAAPKYDIRDWNKEHKHMSRGITLHKDEMQKVFDLLSVRDI